MQFCYNEETSAGTDTVRVIEECARQGVHLIEMRKEKLLDFMRSGRSLEDMQAILRANDMQVVCLDALHRISFNDRRGFGNVKDCAQFLSYCCKLFGSPYLEVAATMDRTEPWETVCEETAASLRALSDVVRPYGVGLALEFHGMTDASVRTFAQTLEIINRVDRDNVGICLDTWHMYQSGSDARSLLEARGDQIFHVHFSDSPKAAPFTLPRTDCIWPGDGDVDNIAMLRALLQIGYRGAIAVEVYDRAVQAMPVADGVRIGREKTERLMRAAGVLDA